jgi:hypothetical protein
MPGDVLYLSRRKLYEYAPQLGIDTSRPGPESERESGAGVRIALPTVAEASAQHSRRHSRVDPAWEQRQDYELMLRVVGALGELPSIEEADEIREGEWFSFHRQVEFGIVHADTDPSVRALVVVDAEPAPEDASVVAMLLNGSVAHVRDPYTNDELRAATGSRSGSGTDEWFIWLERRRLSWEESPAAPASQLRERDGRPPRSSESAFAMYGAFTRPSGIAKNMAVPELRQAPCKGVAQASFVAAREGLTLVMGSPLYVQVRPLDREGRAERPRLRRRLFGRRTQ